MAAVTKKAQLIADAKEILDEYRGSITLRQLYYRLVAKHKIENNLKSYKYLVLCMSDARVKSKEIPFDAFEDKGRSFVGFHRRYATNPRSSFARAKQEFESAEQTFDDTANHYSLPAWHGQPNYVEVWCEKDALTNVFEPVCQRNSVTYGAAKGQASLSWLYEAANRLSDMSKREGVERIVVLVYTDFDPAGIDIAKNFKRHINGTFGLDNVEFIRKGITPEQIEEFDIPPMPVKTSDSRSDKWAAKYGSKSCVELDAIEPKDLERIIKNDIMELWDSDAAEARLLQIAAGKEEIKDLVERYKAGELDEDDEEW